MREQADSVAFYQHQTSLPPSSLLPLLELRSPAFEYAADLVARGASPATITFIMRAVKDPAATYDGILEAHGRARKGGLTLDSAAARYFGELPNAAVAGSILLVPEPDPDELLFSDVRQKALERICEEAPINLDEGRRLLGELHASDAVLPPAAYARATGADPFFVGAIMDVAGPRTRSALWLYAQRGVGIDSVLRLAALPETMDEHYGNFFILSESLAQLGWGRFITDYAELFLEGISRGMRPEDYLRLIN